MAMLASIYMSLHIGVFCIVIVALYTDIVLEEHSASIFKVEVCRIRNGLLCSQAARKLVTETHERG
jgi:hypothetical protein